MVGDLLQPTHLLFVLVVALLVLGPKRLPEVGRSLGRGLRDFRSAISGEELPEQTIPPADQPRPVGDQAAAPPTAVQEPASRPADPANGNAPAPHPAPQAAPAEEPTTQAEAVTTPMRSDSIV